MFTDLFLALTDSENPRGHPILAALLYTFCPAAARWWQAGADPVLVFDPVWQALTDRMHDETLKAALVRYGFETLTGDARQYIDQVEAYRRMHPGVTAPELLPTFTGGNVDLNRRFGLQSAIAQLGGRWENFFTHIRTWAFLLPDWEIALRISTERAFSLVKLALVLPGIRRPVSFPALLWSDPMGFAAHVVIGLPAWQGEQNALLSALAQQAGPLAEKPWPAPPEVWALDWESGAAEPVEVELDLAALPAIVGRLAEFARRGPHPPLGAFKRSTSQCRSCGYRSLCFTGEGMLSPLALKF